jgi:carboxymethylenebutenolidase
MEVQAQMVDVPVPGGTMPAQLARPADGGRRPAVLVIQEAFGLNGHIKAVARRIAGEGWVTLAPDLYWRAGKGRTVGYDQLAEAIALMQSLDDAQIISDVGGAIAFLGRHPSVRADRVGITGFCMGGRVSYLAACALSDQITACVPFYGGGIPVERTPALKAPVLAFFGAEDAFIPLDDVERLRTALATNGKRAEVVVYPGADHGFFCDERRSYHPEVARDAWDRMTRFFVTHLGA